jgi:hypothetical protein
MVKKPGDKTGKPDDIDEKLINQNSGAAPVKQEESSDEVFSTEKGLTADGVLKPRH